MTTRTQPGHAPDEDIAEALEADEGAETAAAAEPEQTAGPGASAA